VPAIQNARTRLASRTSSREAAAVSPITAFDPTAYRWPRKWPPEPAALTIDKADTG
jgi:hypothetical protein